MANMKLLLVITFVLTTALANYSEIINNETYDDKKPSPFFSPGDSLWKFFRDIGSATGFLSAHENTDSSLETKRPDLSLSDDSAITDSAISTESSRFTEKANVISVENVESSKIFAENSQIYSESTIESTTTAATTEYVSTTESTTTAATTEEVSTTTTDFSSTTSTDFTEITSTQSSTDQSTDLSANTTTEITASTEHSTSTEFSTTVTSPAPVCEENIENLIVTATHFELTAKWDRSDSEDNTTEYKYEINVQETDTGKNVHTTETDLTEEHVGNLNACTNYSVTVRVNCSNDVLGEPKSETVLTEKAIHSVENLEWNVISESETYISWKPPNKTAKCVSLYRYDIMHDNKVVLQSDTDKTKLLLYNPDGCTNNTFIIYAVSDNGIRSPPNSVSYSNYRVNDAPIFKNETIKEDLAILYWEFGNDKCRPQQFFLECWEPNEETLFFEGEIRNEEIVVKVYGFSAYTNYTCCGIISNEKGNSSCGNHTLRTKPKAPEEPSDLHINCTDNSDEISISWGPPKKWNGEEDEYNLILEYINLKYDLPMGCQEIKPKVINKTFKSQLEKQFSFKVTDIIARATYKVSVMAKSNGGWGNAISASFSTTERVPGSPSVNSSVLFTPQVYEYNATLKLSWCIECYTNGKPENFTIYLNGFRENYANHDKKFEVPSEGEKCYNLPDIQLKAEFTYTVQVILNLEGYSSTPQKETFTTPAGIPGISTTPNLDQPKTENVSDSTTQAQIILSRDFFNESNGNILYYAIIVAHEGCEEKPTSSFYNETDWPTVRNDKECDNDSKAYQATEKMWKPFESNPTGRSNEIVYILGENCSCVLSNDDDFCNKPLKPDTNYSVKFRGFTKNGFTDTVFVYFQTSVPETDINLGLIIGLLVGILGIAFIIAAILFYTKGKLNFKAWPRMESGSQVSPTPLPVPIKKFDSHYRKMMENPGKIKNEFQLLITVSSDVALSTKSALLPVNKKKNRYINILPYDKTRVTLQEYNSTSTDYINASYIQGYSGSIEYIATQGPTEATCPAFWQMILEQNVRLIVMLTQFVECGKDKCYKYFPDVKEAYDLTNIKIHCVEQQLLTLYNRRIFKLMKGDTVKKIIHVQFNLWPDFGVPSDVSHLIEFCETIKEIKMKKPSKIVMHCSAGVGRTGTLIAMDILLQTIRDKRKVDIFGTVLNLRKQRMTMVQSEKQYEFLYKCVHYAITRNDNSKKQEQITESNM